MPGAADACKEAAISYLCAGLCVLPAIRSQKRPALPSWKAFQNELPSEEQVSRWFDRADALCLIAGSISGNLEMVDFDCGGELFDGWAELVEAEDPSLLARLVIERSQSGGWHAVYRCQSAASKNLKLAHRTIETADDQPVTIQGKQYVPRLVDGRWQVTITLIETRGEGGLFLCHPSPGYELIQGEFEHLPVLTDAERDLVLRAAWSLNEAPTEPLFAPPVAMPSGDRPGDDFNQRGDVRELLRKHGWTLARSGENEYWRRPGKTSGSSATLKSGVFYVFSQNASPFQADQAYPPFALYALLEHGGDFAAAASALRSQGYGQDPPEPTDVDLSKICDRPRIEVAEVVVARLRPRDPGPIPEELFRVPGFVGDVIAFCLRSARYPSLPLAFCGAMALQSFLSSLVAEHPAKSWTSTKAGVTIET